MGYSKGSLSYELTKETEKEMLKYAEKHYNDRYFMLYVAKEREWSNTEKRP